MVDDNTANSTAVESFIRRDKIITIIAIAILVGATFTYTVLGVGMNMSAIQMTPGLGQSQMSMPNMSAMKNMAATPAVWTFNYSVLMFLMWWTMMIAMMLPSASPMILLYTALIRRTKKTKSISDKLPHLFADIYWLGQPSVFLLRHFSRSSSCVIGCLP